MAKYVIEDTTLTGIANAIRAKTGSTDPIPVTDMAAQIAAITGGGGSGDTGGAVEGIVYVTFMNGDTELCKTACMKGDSTVDPVEDGKIAVPTKDPTVSTVYTYAGGWSLTEGGEADVAALVDVSEDRVVYAVYAESAREYTINFYDDDGTTLLESLQVAYGTVPRPSTPEKEGYYLSAWSPELAAVTGDADYQVVWDETLTFANGTWAKISEVCEAGQAAEYFAVGDTKTVVHGDKQYVLKIIGLNVDTKTSGGTAGITVFITNGVSSATWGLNVFQSTVIDTLHSTATSFVSTALPADCVSVIKPVTKTTAYRGSSGFTTDTDTDVLAFVPSYTELTGSHIATNAKEPLGAYEGFYGENVVNRVLTDANGTAVAWATRTIDQASLGTSAKWYIVETNTSCYLKSLTVPNTQNIGVCFCI